MIVKRYSILIIFCMVFAAFSASASQLFWFVSAAIEKPSKEIANMFNVAHDDKVIVIPGGTGQVLQKMILSKKGDIYGCIDEKFFKMAQTKGIIKKYVKFIKLTPAFGLASGVGIKSFDDLMKPGVVIAAGNPKTMALGKTYMHILNRLPKDKREKFEKNVKIQAVNISQIINYINTNSVDAGLIFDAVAKYNDMKYIEIPKQYNQIKIGYLAEIVFGKNLKAKNELFDFIVKHFNIYKQVGFEIIYK